MAELKLSKGANSKAIAADLIANHGIDEAIGIAIENVVSAKAACDNYSHSIWREVRNHLSKQQ